MAAFRARFFFGLAFSTRLGTLDLTECFAQVLTSAQATAGGTSKSQEANLAGQVISTNAIYTDLAIIARNNLDKGLDVFERLMRLALKAQSNCRATAETLVRYRTLQRYSLGKRTSRRDRSK